MGCQSKWIFAVSIFAALALSTLPAVGQKVPPPAMPPQNVVVVNTSGQPVPTAAQGTTTVSGTVNVGNTPNVNVANTPSVNVANTPSVSITGTANVTTPLDNQFNPVPLAVSEEYHPFEDTYTITFAGNGA